MKCPHCGSKRIQGTNIGERFFARALSAGAGLIAAIAGPSVSMAAMTQTNRNVCKYRDFICLDCKREFAEERN